MFGARSAMIGRLQRGKRCLLPTVLLNTYGTYIPRRCACIGFGCRACRELPRPDPPHLN